MKRIVLILLVIALSCAMLIGCKKDKGEPQENAGSGTGTSDSSGDGVGGNGSGSTDEGSGGGSTVGQGGTGSDAGVDLLRDDLSAYIEIDPKYYKDYTAVLDRKKLSVIVESEIIQTLYKYRSAEPIEIDGIISVGDTVGIFYKGYYIEDGEKVYFEGGSNVGGAAYELGIGSGGFIPGFEYSMIGKDPADYDESNPMLIESYFPDGYQATELAGKLAYFEVTVEIKDGKYNITEHASPELTDEFVSNVLQMSLDTLADYEGESLTEKYRSYVYEKCASENGYDTESLKINAFWESVMSGCVVKEYPENLLNESVASIKSNIEYQYKNSYYSYMYTLEQYIALCLGLSQDANAETVAATLKEKAKPYVKQDLILYHIMNVEGLKPDEAGYKEIFDDYMEKTLGPDIDPDGKLSVEEYKAELEKRKGEIVKYYGEDYVKLVIYNNIVIDYILDYGNIVEITK